MKSAKETGCFPYQSPLVCYFEVFEDGTVRQVSNKNDKIVACVNVQTGRSILFAVWPGQWRSDLFIIDDMKSFAKENNITL